MTIQTGWRWCSQCQGLVYGTGQGSCAAGGVHDTTASGLYSLDMDEPTAPGQHNWRWCSKCQYLVFSGGGVCAAGGQHATGSSSDYALPQAPGSDPQADGQQGWRWCSKCQGLHFGVEGGRCPAGGAHDGRTSGHYAVHHSPNTGFRPERDGFRFQNAFTNDFVPVLDVRTGGLCGGMSYAALDYVNARMPIPKQTFRPANGTPLHSYLYNRQVDSITSNLDKWAEVGMNPGGVRNKEIFNWGISAKKGERIDELKQFLDNGAPCVLCLQGDGGTGNHQVIAFGYLMGRYQGDLGAHVEDFRIFVGDPNYPNQMRTLVADVGRQIYHYQEGGTETWRTYFVDRNYHPKQPPAIPNASYPADGLVHELVLAFFTGGDDLRGGNDNVDLVINLADGTQESHRNINLGARWIVNNDESAEVILQRPVRLEQLHNLVISTTFGGGIGGDNWDMNALDVYALGGGGTLTLIKHVGFKRFTGDDKTLVVPLVVAAPSQANVLQLTIRTGGDDLRGGNDNLNVSLRYRDGRTQSVPNVNGGARWADNTTNVVNVDLDHAVAPGDVVAVTLQTTFGGGMGGDNWNMDSVQVTALGNGVNQVIFTSGGKRFTGDDKTLTMNHA